MKKQTDIHSEIEKTLRSLDQIEPVKTDAFFYSRLSAKIEHRNEEKYQLSSSTEFGFKLAFAAVLILISINLISLIQYQPGNNNIQTEITTENWAEEYTAGYQVLDLSYYESLEQD